MNITRRLFLAAAATCVFVWPSAPAAWSQDAIASIQPEADEVLREVSTYLLSLDSFSSDLSVVMNMEAEGLKQEMSTAYTLAVRRPNKLALTLLKGMMGVSVVSDGTSLYSYMPAVKRYVVEKAPETLSDISEESELWRMGIGPAMGGIGMVDSLIAANPYEVIMEGVTSGVYVGTNDIGGTLCHHLSYQQDEFDWEVWVEVGDQPVLRRLVPDLTKAFGRMEDTMPGFERPEIRLSVTFENWKTGENIPDDVFVFTPPEGAEKAESFFDIGADTAGEEESSLQGQPAPDFSLDLLDGTRMELASHLSNDVVVLDFWATWCGPCRRALPIVAGITREYADQGVAFYAVNEQEDAEKIRKFLEDQKIDCKVALDTDGDVGSLYHVEGIPQTVVIGKDGAVAAVHVGFSSDMAGELREMLDALLSPPAVAEDVPATDQDPPADEASAEDTI